MSEPDTLRAGRMEPRGQRRERVEIGAGLDDDQKTSRRIELAQQIAEKRERVRDRSGRGR